MTGKRLLLVASEPLWPAVHGGRVDPWHRHKALKALGWEMSLACWYKAGEEPTAADMAMMGQLFQPVLCLPKAHGLMGALRRFLYLPLYSTHVTSRLLSARALADVVSALQAAPPDAILVEQIYGLPLARALAKRFDAPLLIRSQNVEHRYMSGQSADAVGLAKTVQLAMAAAHLEAMETRAFKEADWVFDISADDMAEWQAKGVERISWAPTFFVRDQISGSAGGGEPRFDAVFLGNLNTPNNVAGLRWLIGKVLPLVQKTRPDFTLLVAGSRPIDEVKTLAQAPGVTLMPDVADPVATRNLGRMLINPVLSGSGLNIKCVEMLFHDVPVVVTSQAVRGFSPEVRAAFHVADGTEAFADAIIAALDAPPGADPVRQRTRGLFTEDGARAFSATIDQAIARKAASRAAPMTGAPE